MTENCSESLRFETTEEENSRLREENARLHHILAAHGIVLPQPPPGNPLPTEADVTAAPIDRDERARQRIALFRSLFRGREDVYARRWENADGRMGYMPAAVKDWNAINRSRPQDRKKVDEKTRRFLPLTDAVMEQHLHGRIIVPNRATYRAIHAISTHNESISCVFSMGRLLQLPPPPPILFHLPRAGWLL